MYWCALIKNTVVVANRWKSMEQMFFCERFPMPLMFWNVTMSMTAFTLCNISFGCWKFQDGAGESYEGNEMAFINKEIANPEATLKAFSISLLPRSHGYLRLLFCPWVADKCGIDTEFIASKYISMSDTCHVPNGWLVFSKMSLTWVTWDLIHDIMKLVSIMAWLKYKYGFMIFIASCFAKPSAAIVLTM